MNPVTIKKDKSRLISNLAQEGMITLRQISWDLTFGVDIYDGTKDSAYWRHLKKNGLQSVRNLIDSMEKEIDEMEVFMKDFEENGWHYWNAVHTEKNEIPLVNVSYQVKVQFHGRCFFYCAYWDGTQWLDENGHEFEQFDLIVGFREWNKDFEE